MGHTVIDTDVPVPVSVLLPVYNAEAHIAEAIQSILVQTYGNFELLLINDGSTDRSLEVISSFRDERIRLVNNESNLKLIATLNKGIDLARGKYIARMDADDVSLPQRLQKQVDFMEAHPETGVCGSWFESFGNHRSIVRYPEKDEDIRIMMLYQTPFCHPSIIFRKDIFDKNGIRFLPEFIHAEDYEAWVRLADHTRFANIPEVLLKYRLHGHSVSAAHQNVQEKNTIKIIRKIFERTGAGATDADIILFRQAVYSNFKAEKNFIQSVEKIFTGLLNANSRSHFFPEKALEKFLARKWFHLCYNSTSLGKWAYDFYAQSSLSQAEPVSTIIKLKFFIKSVLK